MKATKDYLILEQEELCSTLHNDKKTMDFYNITLKDLETIKEALILLLEQKPNSRKVKKMLRETTNYIDRIKKIDKKGA